MKKKTIIKRISVIQISKVTAIMYAAMIFVLAGMLVLVDVASGNIAENMMLDVAMLIGAPLLYGLIGGIAFAIMAVMYNFAAKYVGGIEFETE